MDVKAIVNLAVESVNKNPIPVVVNRAAIDETVRAIVSSPQHFGCVAEEDGTIVGALGALTQSSFWHHRMSCSVLMFYTTRPGAGIKMIRDFTAWVKGRPTIKVATFSLEPGMDDRVAKLLRRLGYVHEFLSLSYVRGAI